MDTQLSSDSTNIWPLTDLNALSVTGTLVQEPDLLVGATGEIVAVVVLAAYSAESGHRFRANPATPRSPATQGLSALSSVADFRPIWLTVCALILLSK